MTAALFLGNSHISAFKLAHDDMDPSDLPRCAFFCARGADLAFTEISNGKIRGLKTADLTKEELQLFHPEANAFYTNRYVNEKLPHGNVSYQFALTGGTPEIDLSDVGAVFYICGTSPYDFKRLGEGAMPIAPSLRRLLLSQMMKDRFLLRRQIEAMQKYNPECRHYFIGCPLPATGVAATADEKAVVTEKRRIVASLANGFLFDSVFMPPDDLLSDSLLGTRGEYAAGGKQESEVYQGVALTKPDVYHMNKVYGAKVFSSFVKPLIGDFR